MRSNPRVIRDHSCDLNSDQADIFTQLISSGYFVDLRRKFRKFCTVSATIPQSRKIFKSTDAIYEERIRHLQHHYYMIHPFSDFRAIWENIMIVVYLLLLGGLMTLELSFITRTPEIILFPKFCLDVLCYVNTVMRFFLGYLCPKEKKVILDPKKVAGYYVFGSYYVTGMFFVDILSSVPVTFIIYLTGRTDLWTWKALFFLKLLRTPRLVSHVNNFFIRQMYESSVFKPLRLLVGFFIVIFWFIAAANYLQTLTMGEKIYSWSFLEVHIFLVKMCSEVVECLLLVGPEPMPVGTSWQHKILPICFLILGSCFNIVIFALVMSMYQSRNSSGKKHNESLMEIEQYLTYKKVNPELKKKVRRFVDFKHTRRLLTEGQILGLLSETLREDVMYHKTQTLLEKVEFFQDLPNQLFMAIVSKLKTELFLKQEVIYEIGSPSTCIYFITVGAVALYTEDTEIFRYSEGKYFGEISMLTNSPRFLNAVARSDCELLFLKKNDFFEILKPYPTIQTAIMLMTMEKQSKLENIIRYFKSKKSV